MSRFRVQNLSRLTKLMHESRKRWLNNNWEKTLKVHGDEIEQILEKINLFDLWSNELQNYEVASAMIPEMFVDAYASIHFACCGLYKYACMCLRSELEIVLRLVYFSAHPVEYEWWLKGKELHKVLRGGEDVWGSGYIYFENLENIHNFERICEDNKKLFGGDKKLKNVYDTLSQFIHTGAGRFQTRPERFSPEYNLEKFKEWLDFATKVHTYINVMLALNFLDEFKKLPENDRDRILKIGIGNYYKDKIKEVLGI